MKKIPDNATKVFEGVIFDVYHWDQEMFDGSTATFEAIKKRDTVVVLAVTDGKVIINHEEQPYKAPFISLPGGMCEKESIDTLLDAKRELLEETGFSSDEWSLWFVADPLHHPKIDWNNTFYIAKNCKKTRLPQLDAGEKIETKQVTFDELLELRHNPAFRNKEIISILEQAAIEERSRKKLQDMLGITT